MTDERIIICDIVNGCADCPRMGDDCDGDPDRMGEHEIEALKTENKVLENIINSQKRTIESYQQIFRLQEAEIERLRHDNQLQNNKQKV